MRITVLLGSIQWILNGRVCWRWCDMTTAWGCSVSVLLTSRVSVHWRDSDLVIRYRLNFALGPRVGGRCSHSTGKWLDCCPSPVENEFKYVAERSRVRTVVSVSSLLPFFYLVNTRPLFCVTFLYLKFQYKTSVSGRSLGYLRGTRLRDKWVDVSWLFSPQMCDASESCYGGCLLRGLRSQKWEDGGL